MATLSREQLEHHLDVYVRMIEDSIATCDIERSIKVFDDAFSDVMEVIITSDLPEHVKIDHNDRLTYMLKSIEEGIEKCQCKSK